MDDFPHLFKEFEHPLIYLAAVGVLWILRDIRDLRLKVVELDTKMTLLLQGVRVTHDAARSPADVVGLSRATRR